MTGRDTRPSTRAWRAQGLAARPGVVAGRVRRGALRPPAARGHQRLGSDLGRRPRPCCAARVLTTPSRFRRGPTGCCTPSPPCWSPLRSPSFPLPLARGIFAGARDRGVHLRRSRAAHRWTLYFLISGAMLWSWMVVQWAPLLIAAALTPALSWLLRGQAHAGFRALVRLAEPQGGDRRAAVRRAQPAGPARLDTGVAGVRVEDAARAAPAPAGGIPDAAGPAPVAAARGTAARGARRSCRRRPRSTRPCRWRCCAGIARRRPAFASAHDGGPSALPARPARTLAGGGGVPVVGAAGSRLSARPSCWFCGGRTSHRRTIGRWAPASAKT